LLKLQSLPGLLGASLLRQPRPDDVEFLVLTGWSSMEAIRAFAGADVRQAVAQPAAAAALVSFSPGVERFEVFERVAKF
jgi:heme-degrading monooxygenase HmoA